ncbi:hypothetical protein SAMN05444370_10410 [Rubrimonas cliftonensis]|uniref:2-phospho-L-lactate guanylyltransferase n=1 Tax=Rubrimonas cliftonensis TaxID=89524 RepID=A0A1H4A053_9RHOB|nr:hypothetical protein SAMN05444370_10410 [Rubrimonas cliftonensis]
MRRPVVVIFVKLPVAGRVKTRLGRDVGMPAAAWWFRHEVARLTRRLRDPRWRLVLAVSPDAAVNAAPRCWPAALPRTSQGRGDLGARMARALRAAGPGPAAVIGADIPDLDGRAVAHALALLRRAACVFGPSEDGGYHLVGLRRPHAAPRGFLRGVRWSGPHALADSLRAAPRPVAFGATLADVDDAADLARHSRSAARDAQRAHRRQPAQHRIHGDGGEDDPHHAADHAGAGGPDESLQP